MKRPKHTPGPYGRAVVTAPQEPRVMTFEEVVRALWVDGYYLSPNAAGWRVDDHGRQVRPHFPRLKWEEVASAALGYEVVARDDAAELRAALREWAEATRAAEWFELDQTNAYGDDHLDAEDRVEAARRALLALAESEEES